MKRDYPHHRYVMRIAALLGRDALGRSFYQSQDKQQYDCADGRRDDVADYSSAQTKIE